MKKLSVPLSAITEDGVFIDVTVDPAQLQPEGAAPVAVNSVAVKGTLRLAGDEYLFTGTVAGTFERSCDRCLDPVSEPFEVPVLWSFHAGAALEEEFAEMAEEEAALEDTASFGFEGSEIQLGPQVWEELVLNDPLKYLCSEECAGLCPGCGANLNREACTCPPEDKTEVTIEDTTGLKGLGKLFPNLRPKDPED